MSASHSASKLPVPSPSDLHLSSCSASHLFPDDGSGVTLPFQTPVYSFKGEVKLYSVLMSSVPAITTLTALGQICELKTLEAVVFPSQYTTTTACTVDLLWTPATDVPSQAELLHYYGSTRSVFAGTVSTGPVVLPCDFTRCNPIIKAPVAFSDTPRLSAYFWDNGKRPTSSAEIYLTLVLRGTLNVRRPAVVKG